jgi:hypothetical protein
MAVSTVQGLEHVAEQVVRAMERSANNNDQLRHASLEERRSAELSVLRQQMIAVQSEWELEEVLYKVEEFLTRYPSYPEARVLQTRIMTALSARRRWGRAPNEQFRLKSARPSIFGIILRLLAVGGALFLVLRFLGWF